MIGLWPGTGATCVPHASDYQALCPSAHLSGDIMVAEVTQTVASVSTDEESPGTTGLVAG